MDRLCPIDTRPERHRPLLPVPRAPPNGRPTSLTRLDASEHRLRRETGQAPRRRGPDHSFANRRVMKELLRTNDPVRLSFIQALLRDSAIESVVLDHHTSLVEGSIGPSRAASLSPNGITGAPARCWRRPARKPDERAAGERAIDHRGPPARRPHPAEAARRRIPRRDRSGVSRRLGAGRAAAAGARRGVRVGRSDAVPRRESAALAGRRARNAARPCPARRRQCYPERPRSARIGDDRRSAAAAAAAVPGLFRPRHGQPALQRARPRSRGRRPPAKPPRRSKARPISPPGSASRSRWSAPRAR